MDAKRVYKFLSKQFALENLTEHRIKISEYDDMNDPFELWGVTLSNQNLQSELNQLFRSSGALCFSRNWRNPMLWSHYGDKHKGICLGFDIGTTVPVQEARYIEARQTLDADALCAAANSIDAPNPGAGFQVPPPAAAANPAFREVEKAAEALLLTKFERWRYEDEVRILLALREEQKKGEFYFAKLDENIQPAMVIVGPRCSVTKTQIEAAISAYSTSIRIVRAMLSPSSFEVIEDPIGLS